MNSMLKGNCKTKDHLLVVLSSYYLSRTRMLSDGNANFVTITSLYRYRMVVYENVWSIVSKTAKTQTVIVNS